jgi:hypothetical protein
MTGSSTSSRRGKLAAAALVGAVALTLALTTSASASAPVISTTTFTVPAPDPNEVNFGCAPYGYGFDVLSSFTVKRRHGDPLCGRLDPDDRRRRGHAHEHRARALQPSGRQRHGGARRGHDHHRPGHVRCDRRHGATRRRLGTRRLWIPRGVKALRANARGRAIARRRSARPRLLSSPLS